MVYDAEHSFDGYKAEPEYALATWQAAEKAGADCIVLCDTNGGCLPNEIGRIAALAKGKLVAVGIHTHNDCGFGVANAIAGVEAGATQVQGTINGYGERTGNCNLTSVIPSARAQNGRRAFRNHLCRNCASFRISWTRSRTSSPTRASRGSARRRLRTKAACTPTPWTASPPVTNTSTRGPSAIRAAFWSATCRAGATFSRRRKNLD